MPNLAHRTSGGILHHVLSSRRETRSEARCAGSDAKQCQDRDGGRAKVVEKSALQYRAKLKPLASRLEKFADRYGDSYYGKGARTALENYIKSERKTLKNPLAGKGR